ncbi:hypothetical protein [Kitasatospora sp. NPDC050543]|uniref:hypothetical protein n=1 Tax=Kitasatospora sp. NPDC050543 TaxID=3364054 RepID=UPI0037ADC276
MFDEACEQLRREVADFIDPDLHEAYSALFEATEALEYEMDGMFGPDPGYPWRVLKSYAPQRAEQLGKLTSARDDFAGKYRVLVNLLNERELLPHDPPTAPQSAAAPP